MPARACAQRGSTSMVQIVPLSRASRAFFGQSLRVVQGVRMRPMK